MQYVDKPVPVVRTEVREQVVEVPQVLYEERLVEVPQTQVAEVIRQVNAPKVQEVPKNIPKIETQVVEKVVPAPCTLLQETAVEVPQVCVQEVTRQVATQQAIQRIVQTGVEYEQRVSRDQVVAGVGEAEFAGAYNARAVMTGREVVVPIEMQGATYAGEAHSTGMCANRGLEGYSSGMYANRGLEGYSSGMCANRGLEAYSSGMCANRGLEGTYGNAAYMNRDLTPPRALSPLPRYGFEGVSATGCQGMTQGYPMGGSVVSGVDMNRDGIPDILQQQRGMYTPPRAVSPQPMASASYGVSCGMMDGRQYNNPYVAGGFASSFTPPSAPRF